MIHISINNLLSSSNPTKVKEFNNSGIKSKYDFDRSRAIYYMLAGHCPIAEEYLADMTKVFNSGVEYKEFYLESVGANYCPLKADKALAKGHADMLQSLGYPGKA